MSDREIVRQTLTFDHPKRVARSFDISREGDNDLAGTNANAASPATDWQEVGGGRWERTDEWGNTWGRVDPTSKGEVVKGALDDLGNIDALQFPDYADPSAYVSAREVRQKADDKYLLGGLPGFAFNIARKMRRLDQYLVDLLVNREAIHALHDRIDSLLEAMITNYAASGCDGVMFCEDWGTQGQLLIDPAIWREEFGPRFQKLCALAHSKGVAVWMHSCGQIEAIVPDLIATGIDVLQFDQPELHGLDTLAAHQEQAKITFWCPVDIQKTLQSKDESLIRARAREMLDKLWRGQGGFIAGYYGDEASIGLESRWQQAACDEFVRYGNRENFSPAGAR